MWTAHSADLIHLFLISFLQIPLLKTHLIQKYSSNSGLGSRSATIDTTPTPPTTTELCLATVLFWVLQFVVESTAAVIFVFLFVGTPIPGFLGWKNLATEAILGTLLKPLVATWTFHLAILTVLDFVFPSLCALYFYPASTFQYTHLRSRNFIAFFLTLIPISNAHPALSIKPTSQPRKRAPSKHQRSRSKSLPINTISNTNNQNNIRLDRTHYHIQTSGQRTLDWNLVIDSPAMNEMKETLGPPGGFGELGFCVQKDGVKFECMGPGTNFSLTFKLERDDERLDASGNGNGNGNTSISSGKSRKKKR